MTQEPIAYINVEKRTLEFAKKIFWHTPTVANLDRIPLFTKEALAQEQDIAALVTGMEVSIDVSTGDHDSRNRLFGVVDLVQQSQGSKHGLILLVQETKANVKL